MSHSSGIVGPSYSLYSIRYLQLIRLLRPPSLVAPLLPNFPSPLPFLFLLSTVIAPVSSQLLFTITDARGVTITSDDAINVITNGKGMSQDTWCQYVYNSSPVPTADVDGSHKYAWNASSEDDGNNDAAASSASSNSNHATSQMDGTATSTYASKVTASDSVDTNATDLNDKSTTM